MSAKNITISGSGKLDEGEYGDIRISGSGRAAGDVICQNLHVSGSGHFNGALDAGECHISGSGHFSGAVKAGDMRVSGSAIANGDVSVLSLTVSGSMKSSGGISGGKGKVSGSISAEKGLEFDSLEIFGGFRSGALVNVENLMITLGGPCSAPEIGGERIVVERRSDPASLFTAIFGIRAAKTLRAETIEGTYISLEDTTADVVRGQDILIGRGCHIRRAEYSGTIQIDEEASVAEQDHI